MADEMEKEFTKGVSFRANPRVWSAFQKTIPKGYSKQHCLDAAMRLWIDLPKQYRNAFLLGEITEPLVDIVQKIVDERIQAGRDAGARLVERQQRKPGQKD
ncbi:MAG: hypothetical protein ABFE13_01450 [Phycisphaerales bacterium]